MGYSLAVWGPAKTRENAPKRADGTPFQAALRSDPRSPAAGAASGTGLLPAVAVGGVWHLGHVSCRCRVAFSGERSETAGGCEPLDVGRRYEPVAVRTRGRR